MFVSGFPSVKEPGRSAYNYTFAKKILASGLGLTVVYLRMPNPKRKLVRRIHVEGIEILEISCVVPLLPGFFSMKLFSIIIRLAGRLVNLHDRMNVVHSVGGANIPFAFQFSNYFKMPLITQFIGSDVNLHLKALLKNQDFVLGLKVSRALIFNSAALKELFNSQAIGFLDLHQFVIYRGINLTQFEFHLEPLVDQVNVLYLGGFPAQDKNLKGGLDILETIGHLNSSKLNVKLFFEIGGPNSEKVAPIVTSNPQLTVEVVGAISRKEVIDKLKRSHIVVIPSHHEGLPNFLLESMATGNLVIATTVGGIPEVLDKSSGFLIPVGSPKDIADCLLASLGNLSIINEMAELARRRVERFDMEKSTNRYVNLYFNIARGDQTD